MTWLTVQLSLSVPFKGNDVGDDACDLPQQLPPELWQRLIEQASAGFPGLRFCFESGSNSNLHIHVHVHGGNSMSTGDQYNDASTGPSGAKAFGEKAQATSTGPVTTQTVSGTEPSFDPAVLAAELGALVEKLRQNASEPTHYREIAEVADAEAAAKKQDTVATTGSLKKVTAWSLGMAQGIGQNIAAAAIRAAMGLP